VSDIENMLSDIEAQKGFTDMGKSAFLFFTGAMQAGADMATAMQLTMAWMHSIVMTASKSDENDEH
jgi:hypothetical protein